MKDLNQVETELSKHIPRSAVSSRQGPGGKSLSYLAAFYVIERMNQVFGALNWSSSTEEISCVHTGPIETQYGTKFTAHYLARVKVEVQAVDDKGVVHRTSHMGTGYGDGDDKQNIGKAHELAMKEAESDALKRAIKNLGQSMGLALYDKDQPNVEEDAKPEGKPGAAASGPSPATPQAASSPTKSPSDRPSLPADAHASRGQGAPTNREQLNKNLAAVARVLNEQGKQSFAATKEQMTSKYGTAIKEQLTDAQAEELYGSLKALAG